MKKAFLLPLFFLGTALADNTITVRVESTTNTLWLPDPDTNNYLTIVVDPLIESNVFFRSAIVGRTNTPCSDDALSVSILYNQELPYLTNVLTNVTFFVESLATNTIYRPTIEQGTGTTEHLPPSEICTPVFNFAPG